VTVCRWLILFCWIGFALVWAIWAAGAKRSLNGGRAWRPWAARLVLIVLIAAILHQRVLRADMGGVNSMFTSRSWEAGSIGLVLVTAGLGLAIWARVHIGRNWGLPMSRKADPELVVSGPYGVIRHPIYAWVLLAQLGSAIGVTIFWALPLAIFSAYFIRCARREEVMLRAQFPQAYAEYASRTWMILPFVV
jgi:protein-S-isoprenylcysteine O-methyltransferase Ste14